MALIDNPSDFIYEKNYLFRENSIYTISAGQLPSGSILNKCRELQAADDWFSEPEYNYTAMELNKEEAEPAGCTAMPLREYFAVNTKEEGAAAARARTLLNWRRTTRYCPVCGTKLTSCSIFTARECGQCGRQYFPRIEPCIIVLISRGDEILLARHKQRNTDIYTCIAGFIESGESAEQAVIREIKEETNLNVKNVRYCGSQGWPFPDQLMLAYRAEYESGEIKIQKEELNEVKWFKRSELPPTALPGSMGYSLIHGDFD